MFNVIRTDAFEVDGGHLQDEIKLEMLMKPLGVNGPQIGNLLIAKHVVYL